MALASTPPRRRPALVRTTALVVPLLLVSLLVPVVALAADPGGINGILTVSGGGPGAMTGLAPAAPPTTSQPLQPPRIVFHGPRTNRVVALTFDDGYAPANVRLIFEELTQAGVAATFFVNGAYMRWDPQLWRSIAAAGFPIGNHTVIHQDVVGRPAAQVEADLVRNARIVKQVTGRPMIPVFRPPYGDHDATSDAAAAAAGFPTVVLWDVSGGDADLRATDASVLANASLGRPGSIVLLHAGPSVTPRILPALIAAYQARGYTFVTIPELLGIGNADPNLPPTGGLGAPSDPAGAAAPTPPAALPIGDDRGSAAVPTGPATTSAGPVAVPSGDPGATAPAGQATVGQGGPGGPRVSPDPPGGAMPDVPQGSPGASPAPALARDSAWARGGAAETLVAGVTIALLLVLVLVGAVVGRRARLRG